MRQRLLIILGVGIVIAGAAYWYTSRPSEAPRPRRPALPRRVQRPRPPKPLTPIKPPERKPEIAKPPVVVEPPGPEEKQAAVPPNVQAPKEQAPPEAPPGVPPKVAKPAEPPPEIPKPAETRPEPEKPAPKPVAKIIVPVREPSRPYRVQVASLVFKRNALSLTKRLKKLGYRPTIKKMTASIARHRVYAGAFNNGGEAESTTRRLSTDGFSPRRVQNEWGMSVVEVGWSLHQNDAIDLAHRLQQKDYTSKIISKPTPTPVYVVRVGPYKKKSEALRVLKALRQKGLAPLIVRGC